MPTRDELLPEIAATIPDAADQILSRSYALYRVDGATAANLRAAHRAAVGFFQEAMRAGCGCESDRRSSGGNSGGLIERFRRIVNGNLYGYNIPMQTKELFRTWHHPRSGFGSEPNGDKGEEGAEEKLFSQQQPWPSSEFCVRSFRVAKDLDQLLSECLSQIKIALGHRLQVHACNSGSAKLLSSKRRQPVSLEDSVPKRRRTSLAGIGKPIDIESGRDTHVDFLRSAGCPLDYFFYHNRVPHATNCSEHIDRGALVAVCLTDVPGLEVCASAPATSSERLFLCPEVLVHNESLYRERSENSSCSDLVCIMAGDQLSRVLLPRENNHGYPQRITPCVHRVRNPLKRARVSISYELRLDDP
ncbi:unnamed protein product [Pseudo-nitzschia multistriata]|uniref:Isopenicillin N synthase-like Fe(2+) 2OG dioxygenase domain-containing protein n=1 Tax=Pseudo-nitzschia multistriata TaxID=183589 RepID=A0A448Z0L0_9STRA|nr:unnamed protein product [Pseudo-nitzschia multistriata]